MIKSIYNYIKKSKSKNKKLITSVKSMRDNSLSIWGIQIIFLCIALCYASILFFEKGLIPSDILFHFLRLKDVILEICHGQFPQFNFYTFMPIGNAINTFYPYFALLPFIFLILIVKPTIFFAIIMFLIVIIGQEVCYYCFHHILHFSSFSAFLIAVFQWVASTTFDTAIVAFDYGTVEASIFYPIILVGWLAWIKHGKWKMMTIGLSCILLCNLPTTLIMIFILILLTVMQWKRLTIKKILVVIKASVISIIITSFFWLPIIVLRCTNKIYFPNQINVKESPGTLLSSQLVDIFTPKGYGAWDLLEILAIILVILYWKKTTTFIKQITILSVVLILSNTQIFNIQHFLITKTPIKMIQFTQRFTSITHFLLIISLIECLNIIYKQIKHKQFFVNIWYPEIIIYTCLLAILGIAICMTNRIRRPIPNSINTVSVKNIGEKLNLTNNRGKYIYTKETPRTLHTVSTSAQYPDYLPYSVLNNNIRNQMPYKTYHYYNNGMNFKLKHSKRLTLPFVIYHTQKYYITDNKKLLQYHYYHHYIKANLHKGKNKIRVTAPLMWYRYIGFIGTIIGIMGLCYKSKKDKND